MRIRINTIVSVIVLFNYDHICVDTCVPRLLEDGQAADAAPADVGGGTEPRYVVVWSFCANPI